MKRRWVLTVIIGLAVVAGITSTRGRLGTRPDGPPTGPAGATAKYWKNLNLWFLSAGRADDRLDACAAELRTGRLTTPEQHRALWNRWAAVYDESAEQARTAADGVPKMPTDEVDADARRLAAAVVEYLDVRVRVQRASAGGCRRYAAWYAAVIAAGGTIDEETPEGRRLADQEDDIRAGLKHLADTDGADEKRRLAELSRTADKLRTELETRYRTSFPPFNQPPGKE